MELLAHELAVEEAPTKKTQNRKRAKQIRPKRLDADIKAAAVEESQREK